jgi:GNAT superfamily N-acetyltransferase
MNLAIQPLTRDRLDDVARLFATDESANGCWCMWFIIPVKEYHAGGPAGNRAAFTELAARSDLPLGLLAYDRAGDPAGWCAVGPRTRYVRALKTPTYRGGGAGSDTDIWLVPCFFVRKDTRGSGITRALLDAAVDLARQNGATAIESYPFAASVKHPSGDVQVGSEAVFAACGFVPVRRPSASRVVMRRELA